VYNFHIRLSFLVFIFLYLVNCDVELDVLYFVYMNLVIVLSIPDLLLACVFHVRVNEKADL